MERRPRALRPVIFILIAAFCAACSTTPPVGSPALPLTSKRSLVGTASWYGPGFHGRRTSSGAIYDQDAMTAASTLFPLGTRLRVTNLDNGRVIEVAINDHGPYVKGRSIDLSHRAAIMLGMIGRGTAPVRIDVLQTPAGGPALGQRYFVQVASFADVANARQLSDRLAVSYPDVHIAETKLDGDRRYRVRFGVYLDRDDAERRAASLTRMGYQARIVTE